MHEALQKALFRQVRRTACRTAIGLTGPEPPVPARLVRLGDRNHRTMPGRPLEDVIHWRGSFYCHEASAWGW